VCRPPSHRLTPGAISAGRGTVRSAWTGLSANARERDTGPYTGCVTQLTWSNAQPDEVARERSAKDSGQALLPERGPLQRQQAHSRTLEHGRPMGELGPASGCRTTHVPMV
jgi:hypothetical protein